MRIKPENLIWFGNTIFAAISVIHLTKMLLFGMTIKLPLLNILSIVIALFCFAYANILINGLSFSKQFQVFIQIICWIVILFYNLK